MKHRFRKYLGNRGSALFMVLSTMTALMVLVMAMYFSVVSSRAVQYKVFNQEQAYRTAISISDTIIASISNSGAMTQAGTSGTASLLDTITSMEIGPDKAITTSANSFLAFDEANGTKYDDDQIGSYTVTITRFADETINGDTAQVYDFAITTSVDGVFETTHSYVTIVLNNEEADPGRIKNIFTSTGYVPNDVYLDGGYYYNDVFYDNEYIMIGAHGNGTQKIYGDITAGGTVEISQCDSVRKRAVTWAVGGDFIYKGQDLSLEYNGEMSRIIVGGDCRLYNGLKGAYYYVHGDLYLENGNVDSATYFVNGNVYYNTNNIGNCKNKIYCNGTIFEKGTAVSWSGEKKWDFADGSAAPNKSHDDIMGELKALIGTQTYYNWQINDGDASEDDYIPELDKKSDKYNIQTVVFNASNAPQPFVAPAGHKSPDKTVDPFTVTYELPWQNKTCQNYFGKNDPLKYSAVVIEDVTEVGDNPDNYGYAIVIDTGDDPENQYFIKVLPNEDNDGDGENETFCFKGSTSFRLSVIVKGKGNVVIDVPEGVTYRDWTNSITMHETWFVLMGGTIDYHTASGTDGNTYNFVEYDPMEDNSLGVGKPTDSGGSASITNHIHNCANEKGDKGCSVCSNKYEVEDDGEECVKCDDGTKMTEIYCPEHEYTFSYCPVCDEASEPNYIGSGSSKKYYGICDCRVDRASVATAVGKLAGTSEHTRLYESGDLVYPTCNIFLVSCEESANFVFSSDELGITENSFVGFIYAPYMTYKGIGGGGAGGFMKFGGGMIVSDYIIRQDMGYCSIFPETLPTELMSANSAAQQLQGFDNKSWKIKLDSY